MRTVDDHAAVTVDHAAFTARAAVDVLFHAGANWSGGKPVGAGDGAVAWAVVPLTVTGPRLFLAGRRA